MIGGFSCPCCSTNSIQHTVRVSLEEPHAHCRPATRFSGSGAACLLTMLWALFGVRAQAQSDFSAGIDQARTFTLAAPVNTGPVMVYSNNFEGAVGPEWSSTKVSATPA